MNLRETAHADFRSILSDTTTGAAWAVTVIDPDNRKVSVTGLSNDVSQMIDPDTGVPVSGRNATVALMIADLAVAGLGVPRGIADTGVKPWRVSFDDINGVSYTFKVSVADPDRTLGLVMCALEVYCP